MNILFIGDIVGKSGRDIVSSLLYSLKTKYGVDITIANAENSAHGKGITYKIYNQLIHDGIDYITMGNHTYSKSEVNDYMSKMNKIIVPYNHSKRTTDNYYKIIEHNNIKFCLCNILGEVLIGESDGNPYNAFKCVINNTKHYNPDFYFVDLHAETTAEKRLFVEYFKDKAKVVIGTHTHVQTADEQLIGDCAFISDVGMCGPFNSIIGRDIDESISSVIENNKTHYSVAQGSAIFCGVLLNIDESSKKIISIQRIQLKQ